MDDAEFLTRFEACTLPFSMWNHRAHLRIAYLYLTRFPLDEAIGEMRAGVKAYNAANKVPNGLHMGYHETLTGAWMHILDGMIRTHGPAENSDEFCEQQPYLLNKLLPRLFYSRPRMMSLEAKMRFLEPDLTAFPRPSAS